MVDKKKAGDIVMSGRAAHFIDSEKLKELVEIRKDWVKGHLEHVDPSQNGILGQLYGGIFLVDGFYRAARCLRDNLPFYVYILTFDETVDCLVNGSTVTPNRIVSEIHEMLARNQGVIPIDIPLRGALTGENEPRRMEEKIRSGLSAEENSRVRLIFHHAGKPLGPLVHEFKKHRTQKPE